MADYSNLYRQGYGEAAVLNFGNVVQNYAQQLQQDGLRRQKEREAYEKELSAINYDGVRTADIPAAQKKWLSVKDKYHELSKTDKDADKLRIRSEIAALKNDLTSFAGRSKEQKKIDFDIAKVPLTTNPYEIVPDFNEKLKTREQLSIEDPRFGEYGVAQFQRVAKPYDTTKNLMDLANLSSEEKEIPIVIGTGLDARRAYQRGKVIDEVAFKSAFLKNIAEDAHARDTYLNGLPYTPENLEDAAQAAFDIVKEKFGLKTTESNFADPSGRDISLYRQKAAISDSYKDDDSSAPTKPVSITIPFADGASFTSSEYIPISIPKKNFAGSEFIDMKTGRPGTGKLASSNDYEIVGVTNAPIIKKGSRAQDGVEGSIAQQNFERKNPELIEYKPMIHVQLHTGQGNLKRDYLISYDRMPENVKNSKAIKEALSNFRPAEGNTIQTKSSAPATPTPAPVIRNVISPSGQKIQIELRNGVWYNIRTGRKL